MRRNFAFGSLRFTRQPRTQTSSHPGQPGQGCGGPEHVLTLEINWPN